ncbi:MAG: hypothetical protein IIB99_06125 [Planctomycetes bacterium]|nr:hypothetical protein [Planctomycetota bacterium]
MSLVTVASARATLPGILLPACELMHVHQVADHFDTRVSAYFRSDRAQPEPGAATPAVTPPSIH